MLDIAIGLLGRLFGIFRGINFSPRRNCSRGGCEKPKGDFSRSDHKPPSERSPQDFSRPGTDKPSQNKPESPEDSSKSKPSETSLLSSFSKRVVELTNKFREENGLRPLSVSESLAKRADQYSDTMKATGRFEHSKGVAENIAMGQRTPEEVVADWIRSPGHRANLLNPNYTQIGVGETADKGGPVYWTQQFT